MLDKIVRGISRLAFHGSKVALVPLELVHPRLFMRVYVVILRACGVRFVGKPRYISTRARFDEFKLVSMGERVVISKYVILLTHDYSLTTALLAVGEKPKTDISISQPISIGENVFIGIGAILLPGTQIGDNVIVGAGSVVRGSVPPDSIIAGNPAVRISSIGERAADWIDRLRRPDAVADKR